MATATNKKRGRAGKPAGQRTMTLRPRFKGMSYGKNKLTLGMAIPTDHQFTEEQVSSLLIGGRLSFEISDPKDVPGQQPLPGMEGGANVEPIAFEADVSTLTVSKDAYSCSLQINHEDLFLDEFKKFCFHEARAKITRLCDAKKKASDNGDMDGDELE